jgi:rhombotail lipoprotein
MCLAAAVCLLAGCTNPVTTRRQSSLVDYLAPGGNAAPAQAGPATVQLPLAVGIAFLPAGNAETSNLAWKGPKDVVVFLTPEGEQRMADQVKARFAQKSWISSFKVIPSNYLSTRGGFQDLDKVAALNKVDIMVLVSLNQVQFSNPKWYSWSYWTMVGAYTVKGDKNDTSSFVDAAVFHVPSHNMLFRAAGTSLVKGSSTWAQRDEKLQKKSAEGFALAMDALSANLDQAVATFREEVLQGRRKDVRLVDRDGIPAGEAGYDPNKG